SSFTQTPAVMCMADTRAMPSRIPASSTARWTSGVILTISRRRAVSNVLYTVCDLISVSFPQLPRPAVVVVTAGIIVGRHHQWGQGGQGGHSGAWCGTGLDAGRWSRR